jgi:hypothetical protein
MGRDRIGNDEARDAMQNEGTMKCGRKASVNVGGVFGRHFQMEGDWSTPPLVNTTSIRPIVGENDPAAHHGDVTIVLTVDFQ